VEIYTHKAGSFEKTASLTEHSHRVCGIDWAPKSNRIVTCAQDRNAYVWVYEEGTWKPTLVLLRINRSATCVKWSPDETKFAVGSGARSVSVCYFEEENDWWVAKHIKKPIRSTVLSLDWHPDSIILAAGSTDFKARVFSGYVKEVDKKPKGGVWGSKLPFGELLGEFGTGIGAGGWVHSVAFSASGDQMAFAAHDSSVTVVDAANSMAIARVEVGDLPFSSITWITPRSIVAVGFDYFPILFTHNAQAATLTRVGKLDAPQKKAAGAMSAKDKFRTLDRKGQGLEEAAADSGVIESTHQNVIGQVVLHTGTAADASVISTVGMDGVLVLWNIKAAAAQASLTVA
jgi:actin related protein 2/3 complex subunit 1A/1B